MLVTMEDRATLVSSATHSLATHNSLHNGSLCLPQDECLPNVLTKARYCFMGNETLPLKESLQRPYPGKNFSEKLRIYNYRLSRARRVVENALRVLGIVSSRWKFLRSPIQMQPQKALKSILAAIALLNWLKGITILKSLMVAYIVLLATLTTKIVTALYIKEPGYQMFYEAGALPGIIQIGPNKHSKAAEKFRALMADYFVSPQGQLPWQYDYVRRTGYAHVQ